MISRQSIEMSRPAASRRALYALIAAVAAHPLAAQRPVPAQRGGAPGPDTPQLVVGVLASSDPSVGVAAADAIRQRIQSEHTTTDLYVVPRARMEQTLRPSGYNPDSALGKTDLMALAKQVHGDYALDGTVERTPQGVRTSVRLLTQAGPQIVAEPLVAIIGKDLGDIAKQVDRAVSEALRALAFYNDCRRAQLTGDYRQAMAAAQQGLRLKPTSAVLNLCALSVLNATHAPPDSIIGVASAITALDPSNVVAWANLADAYDQKGDSAHALAATRTLHQLEPTNVTVTLGLVDHLVAAGLSESALAVIDTAGSSSPPIAELLRKKWLLQRRLGRYAEALVSGAALVAADSAAATADFYERQLAAANAAHDSVSSHRIALDASVRYPKDVTFLLVLARDAVDNGAPRDALGLVDRVLAIEPANTAAWQLAIAARANAKEADSALATARRALSAGVSANAVGGSLLAIVGPALVQAQTSQARADWETVLRSASAVDSVVSSPRSQFYTGVAAYQIATDEVRVLSDRVKPRSLTRAQRQTACESAARLEDLVGVANIAMPKGGSVDPDVAAKILAALPGYSDFATSVKQASCRRD
jgi:tetratricopeptide (TPR) repeat protein